MPRRSAVQPEPDLAAGHDSPGPATRARTWAAFAAMCAVVLAVYVPVPSGPGQSTLLGTDYLLLHARRIAYAQEALFGQGTLPAWYPRELMGTPFWSNVQNFPFIPTRLALLALDPMDALAAGVLMAALLSAAFTFLLCRRLGVGPEGAAVAGWTFACAGFFACRVRAGHLPLLEAYPLLPLWLWLAEVCRTADPRDRRTWAKHGALALACLCGVLAGHPQLPLYAAAVTAAYVLFRGPWRAAVRVGTVMALGMACAAFALWPMLRLIGRSTRVLPLDDAANDLAFPYGRLGAFVLPWKDGWPGASPDGTGCPFTGYPNDAYFWDTVCYVGWLPLLAAAALLARAIARRQRPGAPAVFFAAAGVLALVTALPAAQELIQRVPGTLLRSPSRQVYVTTFALALAAGAAVDLLARRAGSLGRRRWAAGGLAIVVLAHAIDLGAHARAFVETTAVPDADGQLGLQIGQFVGDGRAAIDARLGGRYVRRVDDVGFFDSIMLARPYAALLDLAGLPPGHNVQLLDGSELSVRALEATGVRLVVTTRARQDLERLSSGAGPIHVYRTAHPAERAAFFPASAALLLGDEATRARLRDPGHDLRRQVMLPPGDHGSPAATDAAAGPPALRYEREGSDAFSIWVRTAEPGFLRVLESWDPGWSATVNGAPADVLPADLAFMAVALPPGESVVRFNYATPGAAVGVVISLASFCVLCGLLGVLRRASTPAANPPDEREMR